MVGELNEMEHVVTTEQHKTSEKVNEVEICTIRIDDVYIDDLSGKTLNNDVVKEIQRTEFNALQDMNVHKYV